MFTRELSVLKNFNLSCLANVGGVVVIEVVFNYPGLGRMMIDSISDRDLPVVQAIALILATVYVSVNLTADLLTMIANPRLRTLHMRK